MGSNSFVATHIRVNCYAYLAARLWRLNVGCYNTSISKPYMGKMVCDSCGCGAWVETRVKWYCVPNHPPAINFRYTQALFSFLLNILPVVILLQHYGLKSSLILNYLDGLTLNYYFYHYGEVFYTRGLTMGLIRAWDPWDYTEVIRRGQVDPKESKNKNFKPIPTPTRIQEHEVRLRKTKI